VIRRNENLQANFLTTEERLSLVKSHKLKKDARKKDKIKFILLSNDG
jgi:hypothetical protein